MDHMVNKNKSGRPITEFFNLSCKTVYFDISSEDLRTKSFWTVIHVKGRAKVDGLLISRLNLDM